MSIEEQFVSDGKKEALAIIRKVWPLLTEYDDNYLIDVFTQFALHNEMGGTRMSFVQFLDYYAERTGG